MNKLLKTNESDSGGKLKNDDKQLNFLQNTAKKLATVTNSNFSTPTSHSSSSSSMSSSSSFYNTIQSNGMVVGNYQQRKVMSSSSSTSSLMNNELLNNANNNYMPINPFEETNKFRLEQSVLSPNLFHVANTSTPERDTNSLWNIDQRAVLYPADIPTDESSLIAQFIYDNKHNKQVSAAVEAFWTQNKIIIESPMGSSASSSVLRSKFNAVNNNSSSKNSHSKPKTSSSLGVNSPLSYDFKNNFNQIYQISRMQSTSSVGSGSGGIGGVGGIESCSAGSGTTHKKSSELINSSSSTRKNGAKRDQVSQTVLTFPTNFDLTKIPELKQFLIDHQHENDNESPSKKELNSSIRKKLFDLNSDDLSSSTTTTTINNNINPHPSIGSSKKIFHLDPVPKFKNSPRNKNSVKKLPKPDIMSSASDTVSNNNNNKLKTLASSSDSNDECWRDSFDFDDHQFASSPKFNKYSNVLHDIGGDMMIPSEDLNDSVFLDINSHHRHKTPPDVSPLFDNKNKNKQDISLLHYSHGGGGSTLLPASSLLYSNKKSNLDSNNSSSVELNSDDDFKKMHKSSVSSTKTSIHRNRYFCFEDASMIHNKENDSVSFAPNSLLKTSKKSDKILTSPNLSPIRQDELVIEKSSLNKNSSSKKVNKATQEEDTNMSTIDSIPAGTGASNSSRSLIFMETCVNKPENENNDDNNGQNVSFSESIVNHEHRSHYPREEFYSKKLFHESEHQDVIDAEINDTYRNINSNNIHSNKKKNSNLNKSSSSNMMQDEKQNSFLIPISSADVSRANSSILTKQNSINTTANTLTHKGMNYSATNIQSLNSSKPPLGFTTMSSMINETTTNTFNQDSQDTGYQTTSMANYGANGSSSSSSSSCNQPSLINMDTTHGFKATNQQNSHSSVNSKGFPLASNNILGSLIPNSKNHAANCVVGLMANPATTITSTPMSLGDDDLNFNFENVACTNFDADNNYLDFYDEDLNNKNEKINFKTKKFDFSCANAKNPSLESKSNSATTTNSLSFEFISNPNQKRILFGQSLPSDKNTLTASNNKNEPLINVSNGNANKRPLSFEKKNTSQTNSNKTKKTSISLNSLQNIQPVESSTPENLKSSFRAHFQGNSKKVFSKSTSISPPQNRPTSYAASYANVSVKLLKGTSSTEKTLFISVNNPNHNYNKNYDGRHLKQKNSSLIQNYSKSKTNFCSKSSDSLITKTNQETASNYNSNNQEEDDAYMSFNNSSCSNSNNKHGQQISQSKFLKSNSNNILKSNNNINIQNNQIIKTNSMTMSCNDLLAKKHELDSSYMDQSILMNKMSPSEYARNVLEKAKHDLNDSIKYTFSENLLNTSNDTNTNRHLNNSTKIT